MNVLVIPEDFRKDQFVVLPIIRRIMKAVGKPKANVRVCQDPLLGGIGEALKWTRIKEILDRYRGNVTIFLLLVDRDGAEGRRQSLDGLEEKARALLPTDKLAGVQGVEASPYIKTGGVLTGLPLAIGNAIVVSEENCAHWQRRHQKLEFGEHIGWFCQPFRGKPRLEEWVNFVDGLADLHSRMPYSLVVIDPLAAFLPGSENNATSMLDALMPLSRLTARDVSVLVAHHPRKNDPKVGQAARGSSALSGYWLRLSATRISKSPRSSIGISSQPTFSSSERRTSCPSRSPISASARLRRKKRCSTTRQARQS